MRRRRGCPEIRHKRELGACTLAANRRFVAEVSGKYAALPDPRSVSSIASAVPATTLLLLARSRRPEHALSLARVAVLGTRSVTTISPKVALPRLTRPALPVTA